MGAEAAESRRGPLVVVGLGNPGIEYAATPHNAGFLLVDRLASQCSATVANRRCKSLTGVCRVGGRELVLAKPETYMNLSGAAVALLSHEFDADPARDLLVVYDELDLPLGAIKIAERGRAAGHNGARSITSSLGTDGWQRIRIGVGPQTSDRAESRRSGSDYLLTPMPRRDLEVLDEVLDRAAMAVRMVAELGIAAAMNEFNRRDRN